MRRRFRQVEQILSGVGVLDKAVLVITMVENQPRSLNELVEATSLSRATAFRLAQALEAHGILRRDAAGRFTLGVRLIALGREAAATFPIEEIAAPVLAKLRDRTGESVQLYVRDGTSRVCLLALDSPRELRTIVAPGAKLPLGRGSAGRLLGGESAGPGGWLETVEEREPGVASVSAPVHDRDGVVAALSVSGPVERISRSPGSLHGEVVAAAATRLSAELTGALASGS